MSAVARGASRGESRGPPHTSGALVTVNVPEDYPFDAFKDLVNRFPESRYAEDARARMRFLVNAQAQAELNVAKFYYSRKANLAAIQRRLRATLLPGIALHLQARLGLGQARQQVVLAQLHHQSRRQQQFCW